MSVAVTHPWTPDAYRQLSDLGSLVTESARRFGADRFIIPVEGDLEPLSFRDVDAFVRGFEALLDKRGIKPGEPCAVLANNGTTLVLLFLATMATDRVFVPINPHASSDDIAYIVGDAGARTVIYDRGLEAKVAFLPESQETIVFDEGREFLDEIIALGTNRERTATPRPASVAEVVYTTGSTGRPKGVRLTHQNLLADLFGIGQVFDFVRGQKFLTVTPLFHNSGQIMTTLIPLYCGGVTTAVRPDLAFISFWHFVDKFQPEWTLVMPSHVALMLDRKERPASATLKGILCGGAKLAPLVHREFEQRFGVPIYPNYGLTESASIATCMRPDDEDRASGSAGRPLDINQVRIFQDAREAAPLTVGEIRIKGDNVFGGYVNLPELSSQRVQDGWLHTGDLGYADASGHIFIVDRIDNMVLVGGENVYPSEIERFVPELAGISQGFVLSIPDRIMGRELILVYSLAQGATASQKDWKALLFDKVARYKVPRRFVDVKDLGLPDFPRSPSGKLLRKQLQDALEAALVPKAAGTSAPAAATSPNFQKLAGHIAEIMEIDPKAVHPALKMDAVPSWDSLNHLRLMMTIEEEFGRTLTPANMAQMTSVPAILKVLDAQG